MTTAKTSKPISLDTQQYTSRSAPSPHRTLPDLYAEGLQYFRKFNFHLEFGGTGRFAPLRVFTPRSVTIEGLSLPIRFQPLWEVNDLAQEQRLESVIASMNPDLREFWEPLTQGPARLRASDLGKSLSRMDELRTESVPVNPNFATPPSDATVCASLLSEILTLAPADQVAPYSAFFEACLHSEPLSERRARLTRELNRLKVSALLHSSPHE